MVFFYLAAFCFIIFDSFSVEISIIKPLTIYEETLLLYEYMKNHF